MGTVTFINKYAGEGSVSRSTPSERRQINARSREHRRRHRSTVSERTPDDDSVQHKEQAGTILTTTAASRAVARRKASATQLPVPGLSVERVIGRSTDPFNVTSVPMNSTVMTLLRFYKDFVYTDLWAETYALLEGKIRQDALLRCTPQAVILESMHDSTRMRCLLAHVACWLDKAKIRHEAIHPLVFLQQGTESLRQELSRKGQKANVQLLCDAIHLAMAAKEMNAEDAREAHGIGTKAIVQGLIDQGIAVQTPLSALVTMIDFDLGCYLLRQYPGIWNDASQNLDDEVFQDSSVSSYVDIP